MTNEFTFWLARNESGTLWLFQNRPLRTKGTNGDVWETGTREQFSMPKTEFLQVTFSNSPVPVKVIFSEPLAEPVFTLQLIEDER